jgi:hypothetical protein
VWRSAGANSASAWRSVRHPLTSGGSFSAAPRRSRRLAGGYGFAQVLSARLVGVNPFDPGWWSLATLSLVAVAVLASLRPALVATRVDVNETLRAQ